jgi:hypothetical protein
VKTQVTLGAWAGMWGDSPQIIRQLLDGSQPDYLVSDYLAEITMALLARGRAKDPEGGGFIPDAVEVMTPVLPEIAERGIRVVTNAGGLNPAALARALEQVIAEAGLELKVAYVEGDDQSMRLEEIRSAGTTDMFTGEELPEHPLSVNAYIGALPVAAALDEGADIVVTGRCADSAAMLGPLIHEFDWKDDDYDLLSAGSLVGHLLECGAQGVGGLFTDWADVPGWDNIGYPVAECRPDGSAIITKPEGTGGLVVPGSVGEQMLYEIGDPGRYLLPDVTCDWREVTLTQEGPDRVLVKGARGSEPTSSYKATVTVPDGWRTVTTALLTGHDAGGRARRAAEAAIARTERLMAGEGIGPFTDTSIEIIGTGDGVGRIAENDETREAVLKIGLRHENRRAIEIFGKEFVSIAFVAQGVTGVFGGRPKAAPVIRLFHVLVPKSDVPVTVTFGGESREVAIPHGTDAPAGPTEPLGDEVVEPEGETVTVPLVRLAWARSGDKGNHANIGIIARRPEFLEAIVGQVTARRAKEWFGPWVEGPATRWELPGTHSINILLEDALGGQGGTTSLRYDPQAKSMAANLLDFPVKVPASWESEGLLAR